MMNESFMQQKVNPNPTDDSENLLDFGFAKNCQIPTTFLFGFKLPTHFYLYYHFCFGFLSILFGFH